MRCPTFPLVAPGPSPRLRVALLTFAFVVALIPIPSPAHVGSGANCASCHGTSRNAMSLSGFQTTTNVSTGSLKVFQVRPGETVPIGIQVTDGRNEYGFALVGLDATGSLDSSHKLLSVPDTSWTKRSAYYSLGPKTGNKSWTFQLGVRSNTPPDLYVLSLRIAGDGGGRWSEYESFLVDVRRATPPQPQLSQPTHDGSTFSCRVTTAAGFSYTLESRKDPTSPTWSTVATVVGDGSVKTLADPQATTPHALYRVRVE